MRELRDAVVELWSGRHVPAHDVRHALRVAGLARRLALATGGDPDEAEAAGLVHDVGRLEQEEEAGHAAAGLPRAARLLAEHTTFAAAARQRILAAVAQHSTPDASSLLVHVLQDADMLDGLGAVGLVRAYVSKSHLPEDGDDVVAAAWSGRPRSIAEQVAFQMQWVAWLHTPAARELATRRLEFMRAFLAELKLEVEESSG